MADQEMSSEAPPEPPMRASSMVSTSSAAATADNDAPSDQEQAEEDIEILDCTNSFCKVLVLASGCSHLYGSLRVTLLKEIFDEYIRSKPDGSSVTVGALMRKREAAQLQFTIASP